jgi:CheY-like chemotaxis protein
MLGLDTEVDQRSASCPARGRCPVASILIVDDDPRTAEALAEILRGVGYRTRVAHDGLDGLRQVAAEIPDLIVLDETMPVLDGRGMAMALAVQAQGDAEIPIVLISESPDIDLVAQRVGTQHYVHKPFLPGAVVDVVRRTLRGRDR